MMNKIVFPLKPDMQGSGVADLQHALLLLLERGAILRDDEDARKALTTAWKDEYIEQVYKDVTSKLVSIFQENQQFEASGKVDEPTANALNALLKEWGMVDQPA